MSGHLCQSFFQNMPVLSVPAILRHSFVSSVLVLVKSQCPMSFSQNSRSQYLRAVYSVHFLHCIMTARHKGDLFEFQSFMAVTAWTCCNYHGIDIFQVPPLLYIYASSNEFKTLCCTKNNIVGPQTE